MSDNKTMYEVIQELAERLQLRQQMQAFVSLAESTKSLAESSARQASVLEDDYKLAVKNSESARKDARFSKIVSVLAIIVSILSILVSTFMPLRDISTTRTPQQIQQQESEP